jgi:hypothetical protein
MVLLVYRKREMCLMRHEFLSFVFSLLVREFKLYLIDIAPTPILSWLK